MSFGHVLQVNILLPLVAESKVAFPNFAYFRMFYDLVPTTPMWGPKLNINVASSSKSLISTYKTISYQKTQKNTISTDTSTKG